MIEVKNLVKKYGNHVAVNNLSFTVEDGQVYGFLGPNGAGKSTTMNMIIGYLSATEGEILVDGHDVFEEPEKAKKCIGYLPENPPLYVDMTVYEYLKFVAELKKVPKKDRMSQIEKVMKMTHIEDVQGRLIKYLSKGYRQRVGLAQAILGFPKIIILDEPTVGLDPKQIIEIRKLITELSKNHTIILSSHIMQEISAVCDHILIINKGQLVAEGSPEELAEMATGSQEVSLRIKGEKSKVEKVINALKHIHRKEYKETVEEGTVEVLLFADQEHDIREQVFYSFAKENLPILHMHAIVKSLEEVFLEVTTDSKGEKKLLAHKETQETAEEKAASVELEKSIEKESEE